MSFQNMLYRPNIEAAQLIGSANPFGAAAKFLGDAADRIRADKVADSDIAYKKSATAGQDLANDKAGKYLRLGGVEKELDNLDAKKNQAKGDTEYTKEKTTTEVEQRPLFINKLNLDNEGRSLANTAQGIQNKYLDKTLSADISAKQASAASSYDAIKNRGKQHELEKAKFDFSKANQNINNDIDFIKMKKGGF